MGLLDLMLAMIIASLLAAVAIPAYDNFVGRARIARAIGDIGSISIEIERFSVKNNSFPLFLNELAMEIPIDPWDAPYYYLNIAAAGPGGVPVRASP